MKEQRAKLRLSHRQRLLADYVMAEQLKACAAGLTDTKPSAIKLV